MGYSRRCVGGCIYLWKIILKQNSLGNTPSLTISFSAIAPLWKTRLVKFREGTLLCESEDEFTRILSRQGVNTERVVFAPVCYGLLFRYPHVESHKYFLRNGCMEKYRAAQAQDERFSPAVNVEECPKGCFLRPRFNCDDGPIEEFQRELDQFIVGYAILDDENRLVRNSEGHEVLISAEDEAKRQALKLNGRVLPLTEKGLACHEREGHAFQKNEFVSEKRFDLAGYQDYCDFVVKQQREE